MSTRETQLTMVMQIDAISGKLYYKWTREGIFNNYSPSMIGSTVNLANRCVIKIVKIFLKNI